MNNLKETIVNIALPQYTDITQDIYVYILAEVITYKSLTKITESDPGKLSTIFQLAGSLFTTTLSEINEHKDRYASYSDMKNYLIRNRFNNIESLINMNDGDINLIYKLYSDKTLIVNFNRSSFNPNMYSITQLTQNQYTRCVNIHNNVMVPIIEYYVQEYGLKDSDMKILNSTEVHYNPMKVITFSINGVSAQQIYTDINRNRIQISKYLYKVEFSGNHLTLTTL